METGVERPEELRKCTSQVKLDMKAREETLVRLEETKEIKLLRNLVLFTDLIGIGDLKL